MSEDYGIKIRTPECLYEGVLGKSYVMIQSPVPFEGKSGKAALNEDYLNILQILIENTTVKKKFTESIFYKNLKANIDNYPLSYRDLLKDGLKCLEDRIGEKEITFALSHGDFAPWNMLWKGKEVFIFDWESACLESPAGIDLVHFLFQTGFLLKKKKGKKLLEYITNPSYYALLKEMDDRNTPSVNDLVLIYLLKMAVDEDKPQQLSKPAVERRKMIKHVMGDRW